MIVEIPLLTIPNQTFSIQLDNSIYNIKIKFVINFMMVDLVRDNIQILSGIRVAPGFPIIPVRYLESGNFVILTNNEEYPNYNQFGISQYLIYASQPDIEVLREAN